MGNFEPSWMLKVTWEGVPASFENNNRDHTNTFQAILATDGVFSFCLSIFQHNSMKWQPLNRDPNLNKVLMGYHTGIYNVFYNDPIMTKSVAVRYSPDSVVGNTGQMGTWLYRLETNSMTNVNSKRDCLRWVNTEQKSNLWFWNPCPCSYWQGRLDSTFINGDFIQNYNFPTKQFDVQEVQPYTDCCVNSGDSSYCSLYYEKRPADSCWGYRPPRFGWMYGDPHITTMDGVGYTFNGLGEYDLLIADNGNGTKFRIQGRTQRAGFNHTSMATSFVALVAWQLGSPATVGASAVTYTHSGVNVSTPVGNPTSINGTTLMATNGSLLASFSSGASVTVTATVGALQFLVSLPEAMRGRTTGLLGVFNGNKTDDFQASDGTILPFDGTTLPSESKIFYEFGSTWKVTPSSSLFQYGSGESWDIFNNNNFVPTFYEQLLSESKNLDTIASTCKGNQDCIFDVLSTGDLDFGKATVQASDAFISENKIISNKPPTINGSTEVQARLNESTILQITVVDPESDPITLTITPNSSDFTIYANGSVGWRPSSTREALVWLVASDGGSSLRVALSLTVCNCSRNAACNFSQPLLSSSNDSASFQVASCLCSSGYVGTYCDQDYDACVKSPCFSGVTCTDLPAPSLNFTCGPCPVGYSGNGRSCLESPCPGLSCPESYCDNNGTCSVNTATCRLQCSCGDSYRGDSCQNGKEIIQATLRYTGDRAHAVHRTWAERRLRWARTIQPFIPILILMIRATNGTQKDRPVTVYVRGPQPPVRGPVPVRGLLGTGRHSRSGTSGSQLTTVIIASFKYTSQANVLTIYNGTLEQRINASFSKNRVLEPIHLKNLTVESIGEDVLLNYYSCDTVFKGYVLILDSAQGVICKSPCSDTNYCKNGGTCQHLAAGVQCTCPANFNGQFCENDVTGVSRGVFFGVLFGVLGGLLLLLLLLGLLAFCLCKKQKDSLNSDKLSSSGQQQCIPSQCTSPSEIRGECAGGVSRSGRIRSDATAADL
ncbi:unnamed protein product [Lampetra planeri]